MGARAYSYGRQTRSLLLHVRGTYICISCVRCVSVCEAGWSVANSGVISRPDPGFFSSKIVTITGSRTRPCGQTAVLILPTSSSRGSVNSTTNTRSVIRSGRGRSYHEPRECSGSTSCSPWNCSQLRSQRCPIEPESEGLHWIVITTYFRFRV